MSTQQDIYATGSENRPPMLNKDNYVLWSSLLLRYARSKPNRKLIYNSIMNGLYVRRMIPEPGHLARNYTVRPRKKDAAYLQTQLLIAQKEEAWIQLQAEKFYLIAAAGDLDKIEEVNENCILMANLLQASTSGTQIDIAPVYESDGSADVHEYDNCYNNEIFNMFTQEEQ
nr:hypothetical protein [Tanacetum cinerariifolium]